MAATSITWDDWEEVKEVLNSPPADLAVVVLAHKWNPPALHTATALEELRSGGDVPFATIYIADADSVDKTSQFGTTVSPLVFFLCQSRKMTVRRPDWDDDEKFVGSGSKERWLELIRYAHETDERGESILAIDY